MLIAIISVPAVFSLLCLLFHRNPKANLLLMLAGTAVTSILGYALPWTCAPMPHFELNQWLFLDPLNAFHVMIMSTVYLFSAVFAQTYFAADLQSGVIAAKKMSGFNALWLLSQASMLLTLLSNNIIFIWVGLETTTLFTTFLISLYMTKESLEAMWKYLIVCSVAMSFALLGVVFFIAAGEKASLGYESAVLWTSWTGGLQNLNPTLIKLGFVFVFIGFGTKAGLVPMHTWLPDAHSKAPAPVSAIFSGFMLSLAVYGLMRFQVMARPAAPQFVSAVFAGFGSLSLVVAAVFIAFQNDIKRLLAYSSIEHIGIITLALALGPIGAFAALFHTLNHSMTKTLAFLSAGRLGQLLGTHEIMKITGLLRINPWGKGFFVSLLTLIGMAPFAVFMSKLQVLRAMIAASSWVLLAVFICSTLFVFIEVLKYVVSMCAKPEKDRSFGTIASETGLVIVLIAIISVIGFWLPFPAGDLLAAASRIVGG